MAPASVAKGHCEEFREGVCPAAQPQSMRLPQSGDHRRLFSQQGKGGVGLEKSLQDQMFLRILVLPRFTQQEIPLKHSLFCLVLVPQRSENACDVKPPGPSHAI